MVKTGINWERWVTHIRYGLLIFCIVTGWGVREAHRIAPQVRSTANQVANLNNLQKVDVDCKMGGCITLKCAGSL